jgi:RecA-family ATPase
VTLDEERLAEVARMGGVNANGASPDTDVAEKPRLSRTVDEFLNEPEPEYDWVIPNVIERGDRIILTAEEGHGKSTLLRQFGYQTSQGLHPFGAADFDPVSVLLIDLENSKAQLRRKLRELHTVVCNLTGDDYDPTRFRVIPQSQGINLLESEYREWFYGRIEANKPDLVIVGPLYRMAEGDPTSEADARIVAGTLDVARVKFGVSVIVEAHSPYASGNAKRPHRPYGASLWSRWPDFGLHLSETGTLSHWRGPRDERKWPEMLQRGGEWPWTAIASSREVNFARICEVTRERGRLSVRDLGQLLQVPKSTVHRAIQANLKQYDVLVAEVTK